MHKKKPGVIAGTCNSNAEEAETGGFLWLSDYLVCQNWLPSGLVKDTLKN